MGVGAVVGLIVAGYALFTAKGTSTLAVPPEDVALVNQQPVSRSDFLINVQNRFSVPASQATPAQRRQVLNDMIREELFVQRGKELDVASVDPDVRSAMVSSVEAQVAANVLTEAPNDAKLHAYYDAHRATYSSEGMMTVRDLVFPAAAAPDLATSIKARAPLDALIARFHGKDSGRVNGEEFYFAAKIHLGAPLYDRAVQLADGQVSEPIAQPDGVHILAMIKNTPPVPLDFAKAYNQVLSDYRRDAVQRTQVADAQFLRKRANIQIAPDFSQ